MLVQDGATSRLNVMSAPDAARQASPRVTLTTYTVRKGNAAPPESTSLIQIYQNATPFSINIFKGLCSSSNDRLVLAKDPAIRRFSNFNVHNALER